MSTSGGTGGGGLSFAVVATGATLGLNTYNSVTSGGAGAVNLPNNPPVGTQVVVENNQTGAGTHNVVVTPTGGATIEGSTGLNLTYTIGNTGSRCHLMYDGTNWDILSCDPCEFYLNISPGGYANAATPMNSFGFKLSRNQKLANAYCASGIPLQLTAAGSNIDVALNIPTFSAGTINLTAISFGLTDGGGGITAPTQELILTLPAGDLGTVASGANYSPGTAPIGSTTMNFVVLSSWTTVSSIGTDLSIHTGGASIDSAAGGRYFWYCTARFTTSQLVP